MNLFLLILAAFTLVTLAISLLEMAWGARTTGYLRDIEPLTAEDCPSVSIVAPARNEQRNIRDALASLLDMDYPRLEIIAVDDRSTDDTPAILDELAQSHPRLKVIHLTELPAGWLGKNHALCAGAKVASGEYLLFTDADIVMAPTTLTRAMSFMRCNKLDHLAVAPKALVKGTFLNMLVGTFFYLFIMGVKPWRARHTRSRKYIGIGAFNLLRADVYQSVGTHKAIAMRPDDDMMLGKIVKKHRFRQDILHGIDMLNVEWYSSIREMIVGLEKNAFAAFEYNAVYATVSCLSMFTFLVFPVAGVFLTTGVTQTLNILIVALLIASYADSARFHGLKPSHGPAVPAMTCVLIYIIARAALKAIFNKGIDWRGTHYPLHDLKANRIK